MQHQQSLSFLLDKLAEKSQIIPELEVQFITNDSRDVTPNTLFIAYPGEKSDGRQYIVAAIAKGATAIAYEPSDDFVLPEMTAPCIAIKNLKIKQSDIAARFYDFPSEKIPVIGVTGTNGKTSITHFIAQALSVSVGVSVSKMCGVIGTLGYGVINNQNVSAGENITTCQKPSVSAGANFIKTANTTPDGLQLQTIFSNLIDHGAEMIAMEVSSHALAQQRVNDISFHTTIFTNLTQDHLDFHSTMENYRDAKELLFKKCISLHTEIEAKHIQKLIRQGERKSDSDPIKNAIINIDDDTGYYFSQKYKNMLHIITYSINNKNADIYVLKSHASQTGFDVTIKTPWGEGDFQLSLIGEFNISNVLAVIGVLGIFNIPFDDLIQKIAQLKTVQGRMQLFHCDNGVNVIIDYAHTPDALEKALHSVRSHCSGKLICVFGCGGDRDKTKRPKMGSIADHGADHIIITNDNPRSESPERIAQDIVNGIKHKNKCDIELDRAKAIQKALQLATKHDWILIAGKGHETEQIIGDRVLHHSDAEEVLRNQVSV